MKIKLGAMIGLACFLILLGTYPFLIARAKLEMGGARPNEGVLGTVADSNQRAMEQFCTGVVVTPLSTWLVGRRDEAIATDAPDLAALLRDSGESTSNGSTSSDAHTSFISRLENGAFKLIATVPSEACLAATPDGKRVFLLTGMDSPAPTTDYELNQLVVLQSDDQGQSWQWRKEGLFPDVYISWNLAPYYYDANAVWVWENDLDDLSDEPARPAMQGRFKTGLQYSPDGGATIEDIVVSEPYLVEFDTIQKRVKGAVQWSDTSSRYGIVKGHVAQLDEQRAVLWVSQDFTYGAADGQYITDHVSVTSVVRLSRKNNAWHAESVQRLDDFSIERVLDNHAGKIVALAYAGTDWRMRVYVLDRDSMQWEDSGSLPRTFGPFESSTGLREAFIGRNVLVLNVMSSHEVPWLLARLQGDDEASISADAVFYSADWGRSWRRLAMPGYLGVLGMDVAHDTVFWATGNWYDSADLNVRSYGLR